MTLKTLTTKIQQDLASYYNNNEIWSFTNIIYEYFFGYSRIEISLNSQKEVSGAIVKKVDMVVEKLKNQEPIQYILGETEFYGLKFLVNKDVLIPRPETEELVDWVIKETSNLEQLNILDIGTGSGCIAVSVAKKISRANVYAIDVSEKALKIAKKNVFKNKQKIIFAKYDILSNKDLLFDNEKIKFDIIISNPPYVRELEQKLMSKNVLKHEPDLALFVSNTNPLLFYDKICSFAKNYLKQDGKIYFEINEYLSKEMIELAEKHNFTNLLLKKDINNKYRMMRIENDKQ